MSQSPHDDTVEPIAEHERISPVISEQYARVYRDASSTPGFGADGTFDLEGLREGMATRVEPEITNIRIESVEAGGVPSQWVTMPDTPEAGRLMYLHGGGYVSGNGNRYLPLAAELAKATGYSVLLPDYRLGPEDPHPAAVEDAVAAFRWMCDNGPHGPGPAAATFIGGDSAGGGLTLGALIALRDNFPADALPDAAMTISAYADLAHTGKSVQGRAATDPILSPLSLPHFASAYLNGADPRTTPTASPLYADLTGLPPLLMQVGDCEIIRDDSVRLARRAKEAGVDVKLEVWDHMLHVWHSYVPVFDEAHAAIASITEFFASVANRKPSSASR